MSQLALRGAYTALVTPFQLDHTIDWPAFEKHVERQVVGKISGLVPCGTTGESPTLEAEEQHELVRRTVEVVRGRVPVLAGAGSNSTAHAVALARNAEAAGADGVMVVMPYYNRPSQDGLLHHVKKVAESVGVPVVLYNVPSRTACDLSSDTTLRILEACPNVVGVKDASGNVHFCQELMRRVGDRVSVLSGDDSLTVPLMSVGAKGVISVTSNLYPTEVDQVAQQFLQGNWQKAAELHLKLHPVHRSLFSEPSPQPIKGILAARGMMRATARPPMMDVSPACVEWVAAECQKYEASR